MAVPTNIGIRPSVRFAARAVTIEGTPAAPIIDPAPLGMTSMTEDEELSPPVAPKTRKKRSPAAAPATEGTEASVTPKRRRTTRVI